MSRRVLLLAAILAAGGVVAVGDPQDAPAAAQGHAAPRTVTVLNAVAATPSPAASGLPTASGGIGTVLIGGWASWFDVGPGYYAAAGPLLRDALGSDWRGQTVTVEAGGRRVAVWLTDWCACGLRHGKPTLLDLSREAFAELADPSAGVITVSIEIGLPPHPDDERMRAEDGGPTLPPTSTEDE